MVPFQASPSAALQVWEPKLFDLSGGFVKTEPQLNSVSVRSSSVAIGGRRIARSLWVSDTFVPTVLTKEKASGRFRYRQWCGGRCWRSGRTQRESIVRAQDENSSSREKAKEIGFQHRTAEYKYQSYFRDQVDDSDRGNEFYPDNSIPEGGGNGVNGEVGRFIRNEDFEKPTRPQMYFEERAPGLRSGEWTQFDDEERRSEASVSATEQESYNANFDDARQRSLGTQGLSLNPVVERRAQVTDTEEFRIVIRKARENYDLDESNGSAPYEFGAVEDYPRPPAGEFSKDRYGVSEMEHDEQLSQIQPKSRRTSSTEGEAGQEESARGLLYAKQVISLATAEILGFVTQLWVDIENLKVVALEIRPSLLFGDFYSFPLNSIGKVQVGDVILVQDEDTILAGRDLFNCSDLVGNDLFTEDGVNLGKVRDYHFSLEDGTVLSIEFDSFGVPLIPSKLIKTYSLTVDEVIETQQDSILVRQGAENRVRKLSKGFLSRTKKSSVGRRFSGRQERNQTPKFQYLGETTERLRGNTVRDDYSSGYSSPAQQPKRESVYFGRRGLVKESSRASRFESEQASDLYPGTDLSSRSMSFNAEELEDDQTIPSIREELLVGEKPQMLEYEQIESSDFGISSSEMSRNRRGMPMSYRSPKRPIENDF